MLYKSELLSVPPLCVHVPMNPDKNLPNYYTAKARIKILKRSRRILIVDFYDRHNILTLRFFTDRKNHISYIPDNMSWTKGNLHKLLQFYWSRSKVDSDSKSLETVNRFLRSDYESLMDAVCDLISKRSMAKSEKATRKKRIEKERFLKMFDRKYPNYLLPWYERNIAPVYILISNLDRSKTRDAFCTYCGTHFALGREARHRKPGVCPFCHRPATYILSRYQHRISDENEVVLCYRKKDLVLFRYVQINRRFEDGKAHYYIHDTAKLARDQEGKIYGMVYEQVGFWNIRTWHSVEYPTGKYPTWTAYLYPSSLSTVFGKNYHYMNLSSIFKHCQVPVNIFYLLDHAGNICMEQLLKLGLYRMALDKQALKYPDFKSIGIPKSLVPVYQKENISWEEHNILSSDTHFTDLRTVSNSIYFLREMACDSEYILELLKWLTRYVSLNRLYRYTCSFNALGDYYFFSTYKDYLTMAVTLDIDMHSKIVLFPKDLNNAHNILQKEMRQINQQEQEALFRNKVARFNIPSFERGKYMIVAPKSIQDFVRESAALSNCVGKIAHYHQNHLRGERLILFIRERSNPKQPYVTMELDMKSYDILQIEGIGHARTEQRGIRFCPNVCTDT